MMTLWDAVASAGPHANNLHLSLLCLLFDVRLSHLINITYIHTYIDTV